MPKLKWIIIIIIGFLLIALGSIMLLSGAVITNESFLKIGLVLIIIAIIFYVICFIIILYKYFKRK